MFNKNLLVFSVLFTILNFIIAYYTQFDGYSEYTAFTIFAFSFGSMVNNIPLPGPVLRIIANILTFIFYTGFIYYILNIVNKFRK